MKLDLIYSILTKYLGAREDDRANFIQHLTEGCREWRILGGKLGFGTKYYSDNRVSCYPEDLNEERIELIKKVNEELEKIN